MTRILSEPAIENLHATSTISQKLAEGAHRASETRKGLLPLPDCAKGFELVFAKEDFDIFPDHRQQDHAIKLVPGLEPKSSKVYPLSLVEQKELDSFLEENLHTGRIRPSKSPMAALVFFIKKKDGSLRLVQDYQALNSMMVKNKYPLPLISELVSQLHGARYFTKLDICWGFNNVRIKPRDEWKAAFRTNRDLFKPLVMFFGMTNSPATFQTMMNNIFQDLIAEVSDQLTSKAGIKLTAPLSAFDKENSIEFLLDFLHYLYNYYMVCALFSHAHHVTNHVTSCDVTLVTSCYVTMTM